MEHVGQVELTWFPKESPPRWGGCPGVLLVRAPVWMGRGVAACCSTGTVCQAQGRLQ